MILPDLVALFVLQTEVEIEAVGRSLCIADVSSRYEATDISAMDPVSFAIFVSHLKCHVI